MHRINGLTMERDIIRKVILEWQSVIAKISLIERPVEFEENGNYVFVGVRQSGKSYLLYQRVQQLMREGHSMEEILFISFDDERIRSIEAHELDLILQAHQSLFSCRPILFLDEIQNIDGWQYFARRLANEKYRVYITGSNAKMLSHDIATTLGGRYWVQHVYPFSFEEYLKSVNINLSKHWEYTNDVLADVAKAFDTYFTFGGFPELPQVVAKRAWLTGIYNKIFFSDIIVRNGVRNEEALRMTVQRLAMSVKQPIAYNRIANLVKSTGVSTSTTSIIDFVRYLREACLVFSIENYAAKFVEKETSKKHYFVDNGLLSLFLTDPDTSLLENICAIHLYRLHGEGLYFYNKNVEVDFYLPSEETAIQVCYSLSDMETFQRETNALQKLSSHVKLRRLIIITRDEERKTTLPNGQEVEIIPVWKWLLSN